MRRIYRSDALEIKGFLHHLTLVRGTTDLVPKGVCHLPLTNFVIDLEHLLSCSQSKVFEPMSSSQTLISHALEVVVQGDPMDMRELPPFESEEHVLPSCIHSFRRNRPVVVLQSELLPASRGELFTAQEGHHQNLDLKKGHQRAPGSFRSRSLKKLGQLHPVSQRKG